jgi:hypothetical protein
VPGVVCKTANRSGEASVIWMEGRKHAGRAPNAGHLEGKKSLVAAAVAGLLWEGAMMIAFQYLRNHP